MTRCLLECLPSPLDRYIVNECQKFGFVMEESHSVIRSHILKGIEDSGVHQIVCQLFEDESNADLRKRFAKCLGQKEVITLMVLVMGNFDEMNLSDAELVSQLKALYAIDAEKHPELFHEVNSLRSQIRNLNEFLSSMYTVPTKHTGCHH